MAEIRASITGTGAGVIHREVAGRIEAIVLGGSAGGMEALRTVLAVLAIAQDPATAEQPVMPRAAIDRAGIDIILGPADIGALLLRIARTDEFPRGPEQAASREAR
jgi:chemotaxis response regulator CheB